jgi:hypothetical protein
MFGQFALTPASGTMRVAMYNIFWLIGAVVIVLAILSVL